MDKSILNLIEQLKNKHGTDIFEDVSGKRLQALLADSAEGKYGSEINCLCMAFRGGVFHDLKGKKTLTYADMQKYVIKFEKLHFWGKEATIFAVNTWAEFLGINPLPDSSDKHEAVLYSQNKQTDEFPAKEAEVYLGDFKPNTIGKRRALTKEECVKNSYTWLNRAELEGSKKDTQICYQIAILEMADSVNLSDLSTTPIIEYKSAYKAIEDIYISATDGLSKSEINKFQSALNRSGLKHYIPPRYRNSTGRDYCFLFTVLLFMFSLIMSTYGAVYMVDIPDYAANQMLIAPYILSSACMAYLLWSAGPNILTGLFFKVNMALSVAIIGILVLVSMFIQHQIMRLCIVLFESLH